VVGLLLGLGEFKECVVVGMDVGFGGDGCQGVLRVAALVVVVLAWIHFEFLKGGS
jgi:hypothetical protein